MQEQTTFVDCNQGGATLCSSSPIAGQAVEGHALLGKQRMEMTEEPHRLTTTVLTHETEFDALAGEWDDFYTNFIFFKKSLKKNPFFYEF